MTTNYIEKAIEDLAGHENLAHFFANANIEMVVRLGADAGETKMYLASYKDKDAFVAGQESSKTEEFKFNIKDLASWSALEVEIATLIVTSDDSPLKGGVVKQLEI